MKNLYKIIFILYFYIFFALSTREICGCPFIYLITHFNKICLRYSVVQSFRNLVIFRQRAIKQSRLAA